MSTLKKYYNAEATQLDFGKSEEAANNINDFVMKATNNKIRDLISASDLDGLTRLILVNAVYFKGFWEKKFDPEMTVKAPFHINAREKVDVDMMRMETELPYGEIPELRARAVALPYKVE